MHDLLKTSITQTLEDEKKVNASVRKKLLRKLILLTPDLRDYGSVILTEILTKPDMNLKNKNILNRKKI